MGIVKRSLPRPGHNREDAQMKIALYLTSSVAVVVGSYGALYLLIINL